MLYRPQDPEVKPTITGHALARSRRRSITAAKLHLDRLRLVRPTKSQVCALLAINEHRVRAAIEVVSAQHDDTPTDPILVGFSPAEDLVRAWHAASLADRIEFAKSVGVDVVWDAIAAVIA
jgi:hypothetical protein